MEISGGKDILENFSCQKEEVVFCQAKFLNASVKEIKMLHNPQTFITGLPFCNIINLERR